VELQTLHPKLTEDPMTEERMALVELLQKSGDSDPLRSVAEAVLQILMEADVEGLIGAGRHERTGDRRNGYGEKTVITDTGAIALAVPRDRQAHFDPQLIAKYQRRFPGFDDKIIALYARGMRAREIVGHLHDLYGIDVSPALISAVTGAVLEEVASWPARPLETVDPLVFFEPCVEGYRQSRRYRRRACRARGARAERGGARLCRGRER
jgi:putative transposase